MSLDNGDRADPVIGEPVHQQSGHQQSGHQQSGHQQPVAAQTAGDRGRSTLDAAEYRPFDCDPPPGPPTLAEYVDDLLARIENWRPSGRPLVVLVCVGVAVAAAAAVLLPSRSEPPSVDELIPAATDGVATDQDNTAEGGEDGSSANGLGPLPAPVSGDTDRDADPDYSAVPEPTEIVVHVAGAVERPGLVTLTPDSRISDAIDKAGGPTEDGDVHRLNLAAPAIDGMQVRVPTVDEELPPGDLVELPAVQPSPNTDGQQTINVNQATSEELQNLPGIGPALATAIITRREEQGPFASVEELDTVPGIGPAKLATIRELVTV